VSPRADETWLVRDRVWNGGVAPVHFGRGGVRLFLTCSVFTHVVEEGNECGGGWCLRDPRDVRPSRRDGAIWRRARWLCPSIVGQGSQGKDDPQTKDTARPIAVKKAQRLTVIIRHLSVDFEFSLGVSMEVSGVASCDRMYGFY